LIGIEATQKILIGFPCPAGMFDGKKTWNQTQHLRRTSLRLEKIFFVRYELLGRGRDRPLADDSDFRHVHDFGVRIVGEG